MVHQTTVILNDLLSKLSKLNIRIAIFPWSPLRKKGCAWRLASVQRFCDCLQSKVCAPIDSDSCFGIGLGIAVTYCREISFLEWIGMLFFPLAAKKYTFESLSKSESIEIIYHGEIIKPLYQEKHYYYLENTAEGSFTRCVITIDEHISNHNVSFVLLVYWS